jgi:hypothetical protein
MPAIVMPEWLKSPNVAADYARGLATGAQVGEASARLQAEERRANMAAQAHQEQLQQQTALQEARIQTEKAYHQEQLGLQQARLDEVAKMNQAKTAEAAAKLASMQKFNALAPKLGTARAMFEAGIGTPALAMGAERAQQTETDRTKAMGLRERAVKVSEAREAREAAKPPTGAKGLTATYNLPTDLEGKSPGSVRGPLSDLQERFGTNLPPAMQSSAAPAASPKADEPVTKLDTPKDVADAYKAGKLTRAQAEKMLKDEFGVKE